MPRTTVTEFGNRLPERFLGDQPRLRGLNSPVVGTGLDDHGNPTAATL